MEVFDADFDGFVDAIEYKGKFVKEYVVMSIQVCFWRVALTAAISDVSRHWLCWMAFSRVLVSCSPTAVYVQP